MPDVPFPPGPAGQVTAIAAMFLPLLVGIWLLLLSRTVSAATLVRSASLRLNVATLLRIRPRELITMTVRSLLKVRDEVAIDELTGVLRRAAGIAALDFELARARRRNFSFVAAFVDADGLKKINDTEGHGAGDALLKDVSAVLRGRLRAEDVVFRYGGDEFVCLLQETRLENAAQIFEEMLGTARSRGRSFSYGLAQAAPADTASSLLIRADQAMHASRESRAAAGEPVTGNEPRYRLSGPTEHEGLT